MLNSTTKRRYHQNTPAGDDSLPGRTPQKIDRDRGKRLRQALGARGPQKMMALAADLGISPAAVSKWMQGHAMSIENAARLTDLLGISLDWLLSGDPKTTDVTGAKLSGMEKELIEHLRDRPAHVLPLLTRLVREIPVNPQRS
ncbi:helix-turn-helix domain-containing protein [Rhizobiales bacterium RZME27]|uniref:Helix-turn-helix domain-containing protein n=1 Tax=Endobacterium cereale TaxID=2663029 RepID=A0A6A8ABN4_9HYPH|nr:helix-turn-helix domain-containing protein [Endobacterium cereale]